MCGIFGIFNHENAAQLSYYALQALQHRGQEGTGILSSNGDVIKQFKGEGLVHQVFKPETFNYLAGKHAIGHVRYSTSGGGGILNVQPLLFQSQKGPLGLCHNGNLVNTKNLKTHLEGLGSIFQTTSDTEVLAHLLKRSKGTFIERLKESLLYLEGAFAFLILVENELYIALDKYGLRPLSIGKLGDAFVFASETCAFDIIGATYLRDVLPGELIKVSEEGMESHFYTLNHECHMCSMEYIYFSRPDSDILNLNIHTMRKRCGVELAKESPVLADIVIGVPDSGMSAAMGFSEATRIPFEMGIIKNKYAGRTFIEPSQMLREQGVKMKLSAVRSVVKDKRVVLIDDSIVRGTTSKKIVSMLKEAGAKEVHVRIACPEIKFPCFYGVDFSTYQELISAMKNSEAVKELIGADSLSFLSIDALTNAVGKNGLCQACFNGNYPTHLYDKLENANTEIK